MCTGLEPAAIAAIVGTVASAAGTAVSVRAQQKSAQAQAKARNTELSNFLDKNEAFSQEARNKLQERFALEDDAPSDTLAPLQQTREDSSGAALDRASVAAPIPLGGNAPQVVANAAAGAQSGTDVEARKRAAALAGVRSFGDLVFNKSLASGRTARDLGTINSFASANANLLPGQQDLAQLTAASKGGALGDIGSAVAALGSLGTAAAGSGALDGVFGKPGKAGKTTSKIALGF